MNLHMNESTMYRAMVNRDESFEGLFFVGVKTTGIFCRPTCRARKPKKENVEYFSSTKEALFRGYRPCKICTPMAYEGEAPDWVKRILKEVHQESKLRFKDFEIRKMSIDPNRLRRWFKRNHNMTFQSYLRSLRLGQAIGMISYGEKVVDTAFANGYDSLSGFSEAFKKRLGSSPETFRSKNVVTITRILTPLGPMVACSVKEGLCLLEFADRRMLESQLTKVRKYFQSGLLTAPGPHFKQLKFQLAEYFAGKRKTFAIPLVTPGSDFQQKVWAGLKTIPYGKTRSYKEQARAIGRPAAVRAVAKANGDNRIAILIPCHRVIGSDGKLVGYGGELWRKKYLLDLESRNGKPSLQ